MAWEGMWPTSWAGMLHTEMQVCMRCTAAVPANSNTGLHPTR